MKIDGRFLKDLRKEHNLSLRAFAGKIYASKSSVQRWEKSCPPEDDELIERIAGVYSLTAEELKNKNDLKYGAEAQDRLSPEQLAELKFGVKGLVIPIVSVLCLSAVASLSVLIALLLI